MTLQLRAALKKRGRVWGQHNAAVLKLVRDGKAPSQRWPTRPMRAIGCGAYVTRIPSAA